MLSVLACGALLAVASPVEAKKFEASVEACEYLVERVGRPPLLCPVSVPARLTSPGLPFQVRADDFRTRASYLMSWKRSAKRGRLYVARVPRSFVPRFKRAVRKNGARTRQARVRGRRAIYVCSDPNCGFVWKEHRSAYFVYGAERDVSQKRLRAELRSVIRALVPLSPGPPSNDDFANASDLGSGPTASASGTNLRATAETGEPDHYLDVPARRSVWYRWTAPASGAIEVDTCASDFDTVLAVYTGSAVNALSRVAYDDDACGSQSRLRFDATAGTTYRIAVDGYGNDAGSIKLDLRG